MLLLVIGILMVQDVRHKLSMPRGMTLLARACISATLLWLVATTGDPFFAVILVVVLIGVGLTGVSYVPDRREGVGG